MFFEFLKKDLKRFQVIEQKNAVRNIHTRISRTHFLHTTFLEHIYVDIKSSLKAKIYEGNNW